MKVTRRIGKWRGWLGLGAMALMLSACMPGEMQFGSRSLSLPFERGGGAGLTPIGVPSPPVERIGRGAVQVALLLPLSGDPGLVAVGTSMANASRLAMAYIEANPNIGENVTISLRDSGDSVAGASAAAQAAIAEGAKLIVGPVRAEQVSAVGAVARAAGTPVIAFSNTGSVAGPGLYLLSVLPDMEMKRAVLYLREAGRRGPAGVFPATAYGEAQATAFRQQSVAAGFSPSAVYTYSSAEEARQIIEQARPLVERNMIDALFIPDRAAAPGFGAALAAAGISPDMVQIVGSAEWDRDPAIIAAPSLQGAIYPAVDDTGLKAISLDYQARFGSIPHPLATIAYTATILANVNTLSLANPPYNPTLMTSPQGFNGRDGHFRFLGNGKSEYALVMKKLGQGGAAVVDGAKL